MYDDIQCALGVRYPRYVRQGKARQGLGGPTARPSGRPPIAGRPRPRSGGFDVVWRPPRLLALAAILCVPPPTPPLPALKYDLSHITSHLPIFPFSYFIFHFLFFWYLLGYPCIYLYVRRLVFRLMDMAWVWIMGYGYGYGNCSLLSFPFSFFPFPCDPCRRSSLSFGTAAGCRSKLLQAPHLLLSHTLALGSALCWVTGISLVSSTVSFLASLFLLFVLSHFFYLSIYFKQGG
ncbi:hypothetical protein F4805DRAFT_284293 [Annulohypoxylon moriforme]|nr:hypothetical protein F4805DRAFT_284293 [Annulohypoxylon moriforme]